MTWIDKLFGTKTEKEEAGIPRAGSELLAVQKVLTSMDQEKAPYIACLALLTARLAGADHEISAGEKKRMVEVLIKQTQITETEAHAAAEVASSQELANSIEHYRITELMNEMASMEQKKEIIRALFYVACDDDISEVESEKIRAIASALLLSNAQYLSIRSDFSEHRSIFK